jgi:kynureninase
MSFDSTSLRKSYRAFLRPGRVLLTGHSHQAWPDCVRAAQMAYFDDTAEWIDDKWEQIIFPKMQSVGERILERMGMERSDDIAWGKSTHELVFRLFSCFRWDSSLRIVTTTSEFHSMNRQLARLQEEGVVVDWVDASDRANLPGKLRKALLNRPAILAVSAVFFEDAHLLPDLQQIVDEAQEQGCWVVVDAYHAFNVVPITWGTRRDRLFVVAGGYKYAQFGEGICWLRIPKDCQLRPVYTGWFADFGSLGRPRSGHVGYANNGMRFMGATFDASGFYRAEAVLDHWDSFKLSVQRLRDISVYQTTFLLKQFEKMAFRPEQIKPISPQNANLRAGFVTFRTPEASLLAKQLRKHDVYVDARNDGLRLGPAPYLNEEEMLAGLYALEQVCHARG